MARKKGVVCRSTEDRECRAAINTHYAVAERISRSLRTSWKPDPFGALEDVVRIYANSTGVVVQGKTYDATEECSRILDMGGHRCDCPDCDRTHYGPGIGWIDGVTVEVCNA